MPGNAPGSQIHGNSSLAAGLSTTTNQMGGGAGGHMIPGTGHMITTAGAGMMGGRGIKPAVGDYGSPSR